MVQFGRKNLLETIVRSRITFVFILLICIYLSFAVFERFTVERDMAARLHGAENEYIELENRRNELSEKVEYLRGEQGIESEIRKHFDVAREGEQVVIIVDEESDSVEKQNPTEHATQQGKHKPWYRFW